jgi:hypothetical protein
MSANGLSKNLQYIIYIVLSISFTSCAKIYFKLTGVTKARTVDREYLAKYLTQHSISTNQILEVDSVRYKNLIEQKQQDTLVYKEPYWWVLNHIQPAQVIYFDRVTNKPVASYFNCIAEGRWFFNFTWNKNNELEFFPPKTYSDYKWIDTLFSVNEIIQTVNDLSGKEFVYKDDGKRYLALIFILCL